LATWQELSLDSLRVAKKLLDEGHLRSSVSRSYYAGYAAVTSKLVGRGVTFARGWSNPSHEQLPALISNSGVYSLNIRRRINRAIRRLRLAREDADYRPGLHGDRGIALNAVRDASVIVQALEILNGSS
jgi:uncharacterized protein (UPF0332 family)